jgi:glutathione synthase/RimK-type ligase-like ATP-grasp enzyme
MHPITGTGIVGFQVPLWDESLRLTQEAAKLVPEVAYVGWDVAVTPDGPVLVEGNEFPGHHQHLPEYSPTDRGLMPDFLKLLNDHGILGKRKKL